MVSYSKDAIETAKKSGLHLAKLEVSGRHAKRPTASVSGPVGPKMAKRLWKLVADMADDSKRMQ